MLGQILTKTFFCGKMTKQKQVNLIAVRHISLRLSLQKCAILHLNKIPGIQKVLDTKTISTCDEDHWLPLDYQCI